ncbi:MAG: hypothetical protein CL450_09215 [Acidimicrobiaceae bacterium]|nr:hypothetical protein [Acidimicrobiaceae bacterium]
MHLVPLAVNTLWRPVHSGNLCEQWRNMYEQAVDLHVDVESVVSMESMSRYPTGDKKKTAIYSCCRDILRNDPFARHAFHNNLAEMRSYVVGLLRKQKARCAVSGFVLQHKAGKSSTPYVLSVDAICPLSGHVQDNMRLVCLCFNTVNHAKSKAWFDPDDSAIVRWTHPVFVQYIGVVKRNDLL